MRLTCQYFNVWCINDHWTYVLNTVTWKISWAEKWVGFQGLYCPKSATISAAIDLGHTPVDSHVSTVAGSIKYFTVKIGHKYLNNKHTDTYIIYFQDDSHIRCEYPLKTSIVWPGDRGRLSLTWALSGLHLRGTASRPTMHAGEYLVSSIVTSPILYITGLCTK